jgi:hypothetical protein
MFSNIPSFLDTCYLILAFLPPLPAIHEGKSQALLLNFHTCQALRKETLAAIVKSAFWRR